MNHRWQLPEYLEDLLPDQAWRLEGARRTLLDLFRAHGYELVMPPLIEHHEALRFDDLRGDEEWTLPLHDPLSGRLLGIRPDMTLQAARIDAHVMNHQGVNRLCYAGSVVHARPAGLDLSREPFQVGAELYGLAGLEADQEIQQLLLQGLAAVGLERVVLDLGHVGVFEALAQEAGLTPEAELHWYQALQRKDDGAIRRLIDALVPPLDGSLATALKALVRLNGGPEVLTQARRSLPALPGVVRALDEIAAVVEHLQGLGQQVSIDLAELRGYHYHSGLIFSAYGPGYSEAVGRGGRYDDIGRVFGQSRPATGFSLDLRSLMGSLPTY